MILKNVQDSLNEEKKRKQEKQNECRRDIRENLFLKEIQKKDLHLSKEREKEEYIKLSEENATKQIRNERKYKEV